MRIILLHYAAPPVVGGVETVIGHQARLLSRSGHQTRVIAGRGSQAESVVEFIPTPLVDSQHPQVLAAKRDLDGGKIPPDFEDLVDDLEATLTGLLADADWLFAHNVCSLNKNLILTAALKRIAERSPRPRLVLWHHDLAWTTPRYRAELYDGYPWDLLRTAWPGAIQVTISEFRRRELADLFKIPLQQIRVIPNGMDAPTFFKFEEATKHFVERLSLLDGWPLLLSPVRITRRKNLELALHVLAGLRRDFPRAMLLVTGPLGPHNPANQQYFDELASLRRELRLHGAAHFLAEHTSEFIPDEVISDFYRLADLLFLPSREEGFGIPILEAGLSALPIYCADIPPLRELGGGYANYFSLDEDPLLIANRIGRFLSSSPVFGMRQKARSEFTWDQIHEKHIVPLLEASGG
jgi:glycosyltransferase involved in cell wall biosynthesis